MTKKIPLFKILTSISFLLIMVSNEKFSLIMGLSLLLILFMTGIGGFIYAAISLAATLYLFISGVSKFNSKKDDIVSLLSIVTMYIPISVTIQPSLKHPTIWVYITLAIFGMISILTFIFILNKVTNKNNSI
jgi:hypothetical protein